MPISETQLDTWSKQGATAQFTATYETLRNALNATDAPYHSRDYSIFLQGSYKNDTNVYGDSDVDVIIRLNDTYYTDLSYLTEEDKSLYNSLRSNADYTLATFKSEVLGWLKKRYGDDVKGGSKAIFIKGNGTRRDADVLVCAKLRRYYKFKSWLDQSYTEGICFFLPDNTRIENFPQQHSENCSKKHQQTNQFFKPTVRTFKNLRNTMIKSGTISDGLAPSYFIEGLIYNVLPDLFGGSQQQNFKDVLFWLSSADRSKFVCANEQYYLFHSSSPVTWRAEKCSEFL